MAARKHPPGPNLFSNRREERIISPPGSLKGRDVSIEKLTDCEVFILDHTAAIYVDECSNCRIRIGPVASFCYVRNCDTCVVSVACQQFRMKESKKLVVFLYSMSDPHIELSEDIRFGPYNFAYPLQDTHFAKAQLDPKVTKWSQVYDHNPSKNPKELHWSLMDPEDFAPIICEMKGLGQAVNPVLKASPLTVTNDPEVIEIPFQGTERTRPEETDHPDIILDPGTGEQRSRDIPTPPEQEEAPMQNIWGAHNKPSEESEDVDNPGHLSITRKQSMGTSRSAKQPLAEFSPFENPLLTSPSPRSAFALEPTEEVRILYTRIAEFRHAFVLPGLRAPPAYLRRSLNRISEVAQPFHASIRTYTLGAFCLLSSSLLLLLMIVLLSDFVGLYDEGLQFQLISLGVLFLCLLTCVCVKLRGIVKRGNESVREALRKESTEKFNRFGVEFVGDLFAMSILSKASETLPPSP